MPHRPDLARPPAMVLGGLNLVRALGLGGVPLILASPEPDAPAAASRYTSMRCLLPPLHQTGAVVDTLVRLGARMLETYGRPMPLFYGDDDYLDIVNHHHAELAPYYRVILNEPEVAQALIDKDRFEAFARERGLPVPRTLDWEELEGWYGPVLVKPKVKIGYDDSAVYQRLFSGAGKARVFASGPELAQSALARQLRDALLVQEYVGGDDRQLWSFHGYADENGRLLAWFIGRKIRTWPRLTGVSTYLELEHDNAFAFVGRHVAARIPLRGVFKIDFKQDPTSGAWRLLEVNARFNLWHHLGAKNGINLARVAYDYLVDGTRPRQEAPRYRTTHRWLALRYDFRAYRDLALRGELNFMSWLNSILRSPKVYDVFSWSDPAPFVRHFIREVRARVPRYTARILRWLSTAS